MRAHDRLGLCRIQGPGPYVPWYHDGGDRARRSRPRFGADSSAAMNWRPVARCALQPSSTRRLGPRFRLVDGTLTQLAGMWIVGETCRARPIASPSTPRSGQLRQPVPQRALSTTTRTTSRCAIMLKAERIYQAAGAIRTFARRRTLDPQPGHLPRAGGLGGRQRVQMHSARHTTFRTCSSPTAARFYDRRCGEPTLTIVASPSGRPITSPAR